MTLTTAQKVALVEEIAETRYPKMLLAPLAGRFGITLTEVQVIAREAGYPDQDKMRVSARRMAAEIARAEDASAAPAPAPATAGPGGAARKPEPPKPVAGGPTQALIQTGLDHRSKRIQNAARKAAAALDGLVALLKEDRAKEAEREQARQAKEAEREEARRAKEAERAELEAVRAKRSAAIKRSEPVPCGVDGCAREFDTTQGAHLHRVRAHKDGAA